MRTMSGDDDKRPPREMPLMKDALIFGTSPQSQALDFDSKSTATFLFIILPADLANTAVSSPGGSPKACVFYWF